MAFNFFDIANAYRQNVENDQQAGPRTGTAEIEATRGQAKDAAAQRLLAVTRNSMAPYLSMTSGYAPAAAAPYKGSYGDIRGLGQKLAESRGWTGAQWDAYDQLVMKESGWNPNAQNPTSTAYGIGQFLDSTWKGYGAKTSDPKLQIGYMLDYITQRYGDPQKALQFHLKNNWY